MHILQAEKLLLDKMQEHGLVELGWVIGINARMTRTAGRCKYFERKIELAKWFVDHNTEQEILQTVFHEIAHALTPGHGHDRVWAAKCRELGGTGNAYYNQGNRNVINHNVRRMSTKRYTAYCIGCGAEWGKIYKRKANNLQHRGCGGKIGFEEI